MSFFNSDGPAACQEGRSTRADRRKRHPGEEVPPEGEAARRSETWDVQLSDREAGTWAPAGPG